MSKENGKRMIRLGKPEIQVHVSMLPAMRALGLSARLAHAIVPALESGVIESNTEIQVLVAKVLAHLKPDEAQELAREVLASSYAVLEGRRYDLDNEDEINLVFTGRLPDMIKALVFAVQVNYGNFTDASASAAEPAAEAQSASR